MATLMNYFCVEQVIVLKKSSPYSPQGLEYLLNAPFQVPPTAPRALSSPYSPQGLEYLLNTPFQVPPTAPRALSSPYSPQGLEYLLNAPFQVPPTAPRALSFPYSPQVLEYLLNAPFQVPPTAPRALDISLPASLSFSPDRSQFFEFEPVSLSCEVQGNSTGWRVVRNTTRGILSECNTDWGNQHGSSCIVSLIPSHSGVYWCESGSGEQSNTVNITVHDGAVILESPALPVTEGDSVTLRCRYQGTPSGLTAVFYKDGSLIRAETTGEMTIPAVSKSDEGLYKCSNSKGESPESWMTVTGENMRNLDIQIIWFFFTLLSGMMALLSGAVILESPALPVTEGDSVTLRCRYQRIPSDLTADFYKDGSLIRTETTGEITIPAVSKSDEGLYKCSNSKGESPESWMTVTGENMTNHKKSP
ncbi:Fc receptor-like protein 5 [Salvelinus fontinalis]|uniref:Fc receptor-like protein 5 n=1 Tax=Salvelinus fontinalis TaxID=8038 RepID=UPI0024864237|nr:Fc receptor-like protein 5 [Salvelinus fontinalis]